MAPAIEVFKADPADDITKRYQQHEMIINEEFKIWKKTVPLLYETIFTHVFEWPNLTVDWCPTKPVIQGDNALLKFAIGTHTSGNAEDSLKICTIEVPKTLLLSEEALKSVDITAPTAAAKQSKVTVVASIEHPGEVNKARYNCTGTKIATLANSGTILIFDTETNKKLYELKYHERDGFALAWHPTNEYQFLSGTEDKKIAFWDLSESTTTPVKVFESHEAVINDLVWNKQYPTLFASCSDDRTIQIHDLRSSDTTKPVMQLPNAHGDFDINALAFNPDVGHLVVSAGSDNLINCYDLRNFEAPFRKLYGHTGSITQLNFNSLNPNLLLSVGLDRRMLVWDFNKLEDGEVNEAEFMKNANYDDPMLSFIHGGFTNTISECQWSPFAENIIIGCAEDNLLEVFKPSLVEEEDEEEEEEEEKEE